MSRVRSERYPSLNNLFLGQILFGVVLAAIIPGLWDAAKGGAFGEFAFLGRALLLGLTVIVFGIYLQNVHKHGLTPDYSRLCRFCNGPVNRYSEFCEHCGADLISPEKLVVCPKCMAQVYEGTKHCPECGKKIPATAKRIDPRTPAEMEDDIDRANESQRFD